MQQVLLEPGAYRRRRVLRVSLQLGAGAKGDGNLSRVGLVYQGAWKRKEVE